ncbi:MAG: MFS transporter [Alphaproteobacteria bacterium PA2]|nr:MAG: MFS transporter [Alphaproteobacteria bacterium PA2]
MSEASAPALNGASTSGDPGHSDDNPVVPLVSPAYRSYALVVLLAVYTVNFLDRQVVTILAEPIKNDLHILDWQIGLMTGFAFAVFYTVLGLPIARLAESFNRVWIIAASLTVWSGFTIACGSAANFFQLILARVGVGVGEAGCTPTSHSLITDYVPKDKRASALAFFSIGTPLGGLLGTSLGGIMSDTFGWRTAFLLAGLPGLILTLVVLATLKEPRKQIAADAVRHVPGKGHFGATLKYLSAKRTFWFVSFAAATQAFIGYGNGPFVASFYFRNHGAEVAGLAADFGLKSAGFLGLALGLLGGIAGIASSWAGGWLADRAAKRDLRAYMTVPAIAAVISPIFAWGVYLNPTAIGALATMIIPGLLGSLWYGPVYASAQGLVPPHMRATAASLLIFIINIIGLGLGPVAVGALSDILAGPMHMGTADGVRWALIASSTGTLVAAYLFWQARKTIREEMVS